MNANELMEKESEQESVSFEIEDDALNLHRKRL